MRKPRVLACDGKAGKYHITAKANLAEFILEPDSIKEMFLDILKEAKIQKKYRFSVINFCIMDNHVHLILRIEVGESLSRLMQWVLSVFALRFNHMMKRKGHVWYDRFKSKLIETKHYMKDAFKYVTDNPVRADIVARAEDYKYSGLWYILKGDFSLIEKPPRYLMENNN